MRAVITVLTGAAILGFAPALQAQKEQKKEAPKKAAVSPEERCISREGRTRCVLRSSFGAGMDSALMKRPAIGLQLQPTGTMRDTLGVFVARVVAKGPAENAGIFEGDRIVSINGVDLRVNAADAGDDYAAGLPQRRLTREIEKLAPGNVANLRVWSGGRIRDVQVTVGRAYDMRESGEFGMINGPFGSMSIRSFPKMSFDEMSFPRMHIESMPRIRMEEMRIPKMHLERLRDVPMWRVAPDRIYFTDDDDDAARARDNRWSASSPT